MKRRALGGAAALLAVSACGHEPTDSAAPDIGNAASAAQADIDSYAANASAANFTPPAAPSSLPLAQRPQAITPESALGNDVGAPADVAGEPGNEALDVPANAATR